jgi:hypothetical protein
MVARMIALLAGGVVLTRLRAALPDEGQDRCGASLPLRKRIRALFSMRAGISRRNSSSLWL